MQNVRTVRMFTPRGIQTLRGWERDTKTIRKDEGLNSTAFRGLSVSNDHRDVTGIDENYDDDSNDIDIEEKDEDKDDKFIIIIKQ